MRGLLKDNKAGAYGVLVILGAFAVSVAAAGYFVGAANIFSASKGEAIGHSTAYQGISKADLLMILEEAALVASMEGGEAGWSDAEVDTRFKELAQSWVAGYMADRGVYEVEIQVTEEPALREEDGESIIDLGEYVVTVKGKSVETEALVD